MRFLLVIALLAMFAYLLAGRLEASAGALVADSTAAPAGELVQGKDVRWWARRAVQARRDANARGRTIKRLKAELERAKVDVSPVVAIRLVFGAHAREALRVAWCESRYYIHAQNGQYLGLFQMGSYARSRYGHSSTALGQARAAYAYFRDAGGWGPWECKP